MSTIFPITENPRFGLYTAAEAQTLFAITFPFQADRDIAVMKLVADEWVSVPLGSGFTASGAGSPTGGSVTLITPAVAGEQYLVLGLSILDRLSSIVRDGKYKSILVDAELDRVRLIHQEIWREIKRAVKAPYGEIGPELSRDLVDGDTLMVEGNKLVPGPNAADIASAQGFAEAAEAARDEAVALADDIGDLGAARDEAVAAKIAAEAARDEAIAALTSFVIGGYGVFLPETRTWLLHLRDNGLQEPRRNLSFKYDDCIAELIDCGAWAITDWINYFRTYDENVSLISLKNPTFITWTKMNAPVFEPGVGFKGTGVNTTGPYLLANKSPSQMTHLTQDAAGGGVEVSGSSLISKNEFSTTAGAGGGGFGMSTINAAGVSQNVYINGPIFAAPSPGPDGFILGVRDGPTSVKSYRDGTLAGSTNANNSVARTASPFTLLSSSTERSDDWLHAALAGGAYTPEMAAGIASAFANLRQSIGE